MTYTQAVIIFVAIPVAFGIAQLLCPTGFATDRRAPASPIATPPTSGAGQQAATRAPAPVLLRDSSTREGEGTTDARCVRSVPAHLAPPSPGPWQEEAPTRDLPLRR